MRTVSFEEQIMSEDKYRSLFSRQMEAIVFIILQIFFATRALLKIWIFFLAGVCSVTWVIETNRMRAKIFDEFKYVCKSIWLLNC